MTMKITVKNEDAARVAEVLAEEFKIGDPTPAGSQRVTIQAGQEQAFWIHASKRLVITEDPSASVPVKKPE